MKKILSVILATLMLVSCFGVLASASIESDVNSFYDNNLADRDTEVICVFYPNGGKFKNYCNVYDTSISDFRIVFDYDQTYIRLPSSLDPQYPGHYVSLPVMSAPEGLQFDNWFCYYDKQTYGANGSYKIPEGTAGRIIEFRAVYSPAEVEEDTFGMILDILIKVFGTIAGIILYNGNAEQGKMLFEQILGALDF